MGYLQEYNTKKGISTPTSSGVGFLQQYNANPPQETKLTPKVTPRATPTPSNNISIGGFTFTAPNIKIPNPLEGLSSLYKSITSPQVQNKPVNSTVNLTPDQKKLSPVQLAVTINKNASFEAPKPQKTNIVQMAQRFVDSLFGISPQERARINLSDQVALAQNAYALKKNEPELTKGFSLLDLAQKGGNPFRESPAEEVSKEVMKKIGINRQPTNKEFLDLMFSLSLPVSFSMGMTGLAPSVKTQLLELGKFTAVSTVFDEGLRRLTGKGSVAELLPQETPRPIKMGVDVIELLGKALISHNIQGGKIKDFFIKQTINKYDMPEKVYINPDKVANISENLSVSEKTKVLNDLGLDGKKLETAIVNKKSIEIPTENVVKMVDKPNWVDVKTSLSVTPKQEIGTTANKITYENTIGTPKLAQGVRQKAIKNKIIYGFDKTFKDLPEYDRVNIKDQSKKATEFVLNNPDYAFEVAMGRKKAPKDILPESVFVALENYATELKDVNILRELATRSNLTLEATGMGQRIRMLAERNPDSPASIMKDIARARRQAIEKTGRTVLEATKKVTSDIKKNIRVPDKYDWDKFISSITC